VDYDEYFLEIIKCEFGNLLKIKDNYRKTIVTMDEILIDFCKGIKHIHLRKFLTEIL